MIPTIIISEIPFPIPLSVIFSPNHITNIVPVTSTIIEDGQKIPGESKNASAGRVAFRFAMYPGACPPVIRIVKYLVILLIFLLYLQGLL